MDRPSHDCGKPLNWHGDHGWICARCEPEKFPPCPICAEPQPHGPEHVHAVAEVLG